MGNIKNRIYYFFHGIINIKDFDPNLLKIDKNRQNYIGYFTMKNSDYVKINSVNLLYLIIDKVDGSIEDKNGNKYLIFVSTDKNKKRLEKYTELWDEIKYHITTINGDKPDGYEKDYMKIKYNSDDNFPLNKILKLHSLTVIIGSVFEEDGNYYPQPS